MEHIRNIFLDFTYFFYNHLVCHIPSWTIRKVFYLLGGMKIGKGSRILMNTIIIKPWKISIGDRTYINEFCHLDGRGGLIIGNDTSISIYTCIITGTHNASTFDYQENGIFIGNNVWIGARASILPGCNIKDKVLIGAGSTLKKGTYDEDGFYSGVPAIYIKKRNAQNYELGNWKPWFR